MSLSIGDQVDNFTLKDHNGEEFNLEDFKGKKVLISAHPLAWTKVCAMQMKALEDNGEEFEKYNTKVVGISIDPVPTKKAWAEHLGIENTPLLSDFWPHGKVAKQLGIFREKEGFFERANILLDEDHKVIFIKVYPIKENPNLEEVLDQLR